MKKCYSWDENRIRFETQLGVKFDLELKGNKTIVCGKSATGKTMLVNTIKEYSGGYNSPELRRYNTDNIIVVSKENKQRINEYHKQLFIIDRADLILSAEDIEVINNDTDDNRYLIFARKPLGIYLSPNYFAELIDEGGIRIKYLFDVEGWS